MGTVEEPCPDGVIRISLVHYTTLEQVDQLIRMLDEVL
jgi:selenocysteine lyase/cysteine desulfurase